MHSRRKSQAYYTDAYPPAHPSSFPSPLTSLLQIHSKQWRCSVTKHSCLPTYPSKPSSTIQTRANVIHSKTSRNTCKVTIQENSATYGPYLSITCSSFSTKNLSGKLPAWSSECVEGEVRPFLPPFSCDICPLARRSRWIGHVRRNRKCRMKYSRGRDGRRRG